MTKLRECTLTQFNIFLFQDTNEGADDGNCVWFSPEECLAVKQKERNIVYVFNKFSGQAFDHLAKMGCR